MIPTQTAIIANAVFCHRILVLLMSVETFSPVTDCLLFSLSWPVVSAGGQYNISRYWREEKMKPTFGIKSEQKVCAMTTPPHPSAAPHWPGRTSDWSKGTASNPRTGHCLLYFNL